LTDGPEWERCGWVPHDRVVGDDAAAGLLVGGLEDPDPGVDRAQGRAGQDQRPVGQQAPDPLGVAANAARSSSVMVAAKFSRGGCRK
jgi:hypothetical protein